MADASSNNLMALVEANSVPECDQVPPSIRWTAGVLAASGTHFALFAWIIPLFWPGYFIWGAWIMIVFGECRVNKSWFWIISAVWNLGMFALMTNSGDNFFAWHGWIHSHAGCLLSSWAAFVCCRRNE